jgi:TonB-linked SusC/RagA family outer membrane protein
MRKFLLWCIVIFSAISTTLAQEKKITGKVTSADDGSDLPGVSIQLKGTSKGVQTDGTGNYSFIVPENGGTLVFSFVGLLRQEVEIGNKSIINVALVNDNKQLSEVVVTAFGISKAQKALGYSTERIDATKLQQKSEPDVLRALQNKIPGVNIVGSNGVAGSATKINIRGTNTFFGNSQPLFVVDGIPYDNTETTNGQTRLSDGGSAYSNRGADIDPNNIESMTVLKGGAAAALYGTRASNGVILITTKTGSTKKSQKGLEVSVGSSYSIEEVSGLPNYQNKYGTGSQNLAANANGSWGAPFGTVDSLVTWPAYTAAFPNLPKNVAYRAYPNNVKDFFRKGGLFENSISISGGAGEKTTMTAVISHTAQDGYIPETDFDRFNISVGATARLDNKLTMSGTLSYNNTSQKAPLLGGDNASSLFARTLYMGRSWPLQSYPFINPANNGSVFFVGAASADNPLWSVANNYYTSNVDRIAGSVNFKYDILPWLTANYKAGLNTYTDARKTVIRPGSIAANGLGSIEIDNIQFQEIESNFFLSGNKKIGADLDLTLTVGHNYNQRTNQRNATIGNQILFFGIDNYNLTNIQSKNPNITPFTRRRIYGVYGDVTLGYRNSLFLNITARNDWSSTLPSANRSFLYPSASVSWNFSDDLEFLKSSDFLSAGKLRGSISKVGRDADPYSLFSVYEINPDLVLPNSQSGTAFPFKGVAGASLEQTTYDPNLKPEFTTEYELGTELWFLKKRIGLDLTLYKRISTNLIAPIAIPNATGYSQNYTNLGQISNKGIELGLTIIPVNLPNSFKWELYTTYTKNISNIDELLPGVEGDDNEIILQNTYAGSVQAVFRKGQPYGMIKGTRAARDEAGNLLINPNTGLMIDDPNPQLLGNPAPNYIVGFNNTFTYKGFTLGAVISYQDGGKLYSSTTSFQLGRGVTKDTENRDYPFVVPGVLGDPNTFKPLYGPDGTSTIPNNIQVMANDLYFQSTGGSFATNAPDEFAVWDATTIRLREVSFGYSLPKKFLSKTPFGSASINLTGRNLFYKAVNFPPNSNFDPEINTYGASNASGFEFSSAPSTRRYGASLRFTF